MESLVLNKDNVKLKVKASDWEEAVRIRALHCHCRWNRNAAHKTRTGSYWDRL